MRARHVHAWQDGADYLYRVNDDTQFVGGGWPGAAVRLLRRLHPPNLGVVGPRCAEGNTAILTHDLVHRTHLEVPLTSALWLVDRRVDHGWI